MSIKDSDAIKHYVDPKTGYWGKTKTLQKYRKMLNKVYALQRHREVTSKHLKKQYKREGAIRPLFSVQVDLADFPKLQNPLNNNIRYLLVCIDVFSRYLWVVPLKSKSDLHIPLEKLFIDIKEEFKSTPENVTGDNEFDTNELKAMANKYKFRWWFGDTAEKYRTGIVERVIRTIRNLIKRYLTQNDTTKYIDVLPDLVANYNNTEHGHTRSRPKVAIKSGQTFPRPMKHKVATLGVGEKVRVLQKRKRAFDKGDKPYYGKKIYEIVKKDVNKYVLRDLDTDEILDKKYYVHQLLSVKDVIYDKYDKSDSNNDNVGYDKGIEHKTIQRRNARRMNGLDVNNIIDENEKKQIQRGLRMNDDEIFHDKPLPKNISNTQLRKKQKQIENKAIEMQRVARLRSLRSHVRKLKSIKNKKQKQNSKPKSKPKHKPKPKVLPPKPKSKPKRKYIHKPIRNLSINDRIKQLKKQISASRNRQSIVKKLREKIKRLRMKQKKNKQSVPNTKQQQIQKIRDQIKANKHKRMVVVRLRRKLAKLQND